MREYKKFSNETQYPIFFTIYWLDRKARKIGRETLEVEFSSPLLKICNKKELKNLRGVASFRCVADDHFVEDTVYPSQDSARGEICKAVRSLKFVEGTSLRPSRDSYARYPNRDSSNKLPRSDHSTIWFDPQSDQTILIDEPYLSPIVNGERAEWANQHGWHLRASQRPGMYSPYHCALFVATDANSGYDIDQLMQRIDQLAEPIVANPWNGISARSQDTFISPAGKSPQDIRRAKSKGTVQPIATKKTVPLSQWARKPNSSMPVPEHQKIGQMILAMWNSGHIPYSVNTRMNSLRSTLDNWLNYECETVNLQERDFFNVYYGKLDREGPYAAMTNSVSNIVLALKSIKKKLKIHYVDCLPVRKLIQKIDTSIRLIEKSKDA